MADRQLSPSLRRHPFGALTRLLSCIRLDEVCVLQGAPVIGACFAIPHLSLSNLVVLAALVAGNAVLVAHVFVLNDWSGITGDMQDPQRAAHTFVAKGATASEVGWLTLALLALALLLFGLVSPGALTLAAAIAGLSAMYSVPGIHGKGIPLFNSALHLAGGALHFLLGYAAFAPLSAGALAISAFFGLVFTAGHLTHETRDHDSDCSNGIRTNAVAFGQRRTFFASVALFSLSYALLTTLALLHLVPFLLVSVALLWPIHLFEARRALRAGLSFASLRRLQSWYRWAHAAIGVVMLATVAPW